MARTWLLLLLALGCPVLPTGVAGLPFPSLAPPITLLVDGKQRTLVVCLVLDAAPPGLDSPIWFSAGNGSALDAFTYGPSLTTDGTWTSLAQLSLPSEDLAAWESLVCHTKPAIGGPRRSTRPLQLSGDTSTARTCFQEPLRGLPGHVLRLALLRLLLFKLLLFDLFVTCSHLCMPTGQNLLLPPVCKPQSPPTTFGHRDERPHAFSSPNPLRLSAESRKQNTSTTWGRKAGGHLGLKPMICP
ncbi:pre T-cell antigen receptor alpha isoform X2 [Nannospalax galili]|uniref:pre T-cell antigen receptor alpha isoform X2 n=1 Tax=Nannospalax galili TaxID=1026970 RepID=UPI0004ED3098|nr:pre T-cell antigen receptor alpha isoform X2 [Nannospalax galili]